MFTGEHERVDHDAGTLALCHLTERLAQDPRVESHRVYVDPAIGQCQGGGLAVGDHDDLAHVFLLCQQQTAGQFESLGRVRVIRSHLGMCQARQRDFFRRVVEQHDTE